MKESRQSRRSRTRAHEDGFSLVELMVIMAVMTIIAAFTYPAIAEFIHRSRIEGFCRTTSTLIVRTRLDAIKRNQPTVFRIDQVTGQGVAFVDIDNDGVFDDGERLIGQAILPDGLSFSAPNLLPAVDGFPTAGNDAWISFGVDGSVAQPGSIRVGDPRGNYLEIRIAPAATAKIKIRKWDDTLPVNVDNSHWYSAGEGGAPWHWN